MTGDEHEDRKRREEEEAALECTGIFVGRKGWAEKMLAIYERIENESSDDIQV